MNVFQKARNVRELVNDVYPQMAPDELKGIVGFLANYWHGNKRKRHVKLTKEQLTIYELLVSNSYNPATVYRWLLLAEVPGQIREHLHDKSISLHDALRQKRRQKRCLSIDERQFIDAVVKCVETFVSEPGEGYPGRVGP